MGYARAIELPAAEPVSVAQARKFIRLPDAVKDEDDFLGDLIGAAREQGEIITGRALARRKFSMVLDSHPYFTDTIQSQQAYPPSYYSLPRYSTTLWNYSQLIKLAYPPIISVEAMLSINPDGSTRTMLPDQDFVLDRISEPARLFPVPGTYWPADLYVANALQINYTAGYDSDPTAVDAHTISPAGGQQEVSTIVTGVPRFIVLGILNLIAFWYQNRGAIGTVPEGIEKIFLSQQVVDFAPTRG